jgi:hypothetical protein
MGTHTTTVEERQELVARFRHSGAGDRLLGLCLRVLGLYLRLLGLCLRLLGLGLERLDHPRQAVDPVAGANKLSHPLVIAQ